MKLTAACSWAASTRAARTTSYLKFKLLHKYSGSNFSPAMEARNQVGIGLSYRPASLCSMAIQFQTRFLELIPRPIAGLKFSAQIIPPFPCCTEAEFMNI